MARDADASQKERGGEEMRGGAKEWSERRCCAVVVAKRRPGIKKPANRHRDGGREGWPEKRERTKSSSCCWCCTASGVPPVVCCCGRLSVGWGMQGGCLGMAMVLLAAEGGRELLEGWIDGWGVVSRGRDARVLKVCACRLCVGRSVGRSVWWIQNGSRWDREIRSPSSCLNQMKISLVTVM